MSAVPNPGTPWQYQLSGEIDMSVPAGIFDIDATDTPTDVVAALHDKGKYVIGYVDVGGWERYRADASAFPATVLGNTIGGWPDERWIDVRQVDVLEPIMAARFDVAASKGFDAIEADIVETYAERRTGLVITKDEQVAYDTMIARLAHERGMSIALKNAAGLVVDLVDTFDLAVVEEPARYGECEAYMPFIARGKPVLQVEYEGTLAGIARKSPDSFSTIKKRLSLSAWVRYLP